ncbi:formylglycine-generating enzyme family protein [Streptomyces sp. NPDC090077]|uniref:formylglycine-generating enzyme family protein n=1 Tax=Streptomyces sp. NPDC090077 TaxID=3365938 RepID=UPI003816F9E9
MASTTAPSMAVVPAGHLRRGTTEQQLDRIAGEQHLPRAWFEDEAPRAVVELPAFLISRTLVTNAEYAAFTEATGFRTHAEQRGFGLVYGERFWEETEGACWRCPAGPVGPCWRDMPDHPAVHLCATDADAYAAWAGLRLPTEGEWEYAARGPQALEWPWGDEFDADACNSAEYWNRGPITGGAGWADWWQRHRKDDASVLPSTTPVGAFPSGASPFGLLDMAGNAMEWTASIYQPYDPDRSYGDLYDQLAGLYRVARGGSWMNFRYQCRAAERLAGNARYSNFQTGFRCAGDPDDTGDDA